MNYLLEVCLTIALATGIMPSLVAQSNPDAVPMMRKGISVQMPVTRTAMPMPDADKEDALLVAVTRDDKDRDVSISAVETVSKEYPAVKFTVLDATVEGPNVDS